jgi:Ni,Fe-hydrogenase III large subunit/Ni,Fe-hydrogenase III component G
MPTDNDPAGNRQDNIGAATDGYPAWGDLPPSLTDQPVAGRTRTEPIAQARLHRRAAELLEQGHRLALIAAHHDTPEAPDGPAVRVVYLFVSGPPDSRVELHLRLDPDTPAVPTLAGLSFPAGRFEREMRDLYGVVPLGHPLPRRLVRHLHWPRGWYPMRADAGSPPPFGAPDTPYPFRPVVRPGTYEIPAGSVHAGLSEPGDFRLTVAGETILKLKTRLWFTHKGTEKLFEGHAPASRVALAERISGDTAVGHALAYCLAVEDATGTQVLPEAARMRAILLELERLHNHVTDLGALCDDAGHSALHAHALRIRETLLRLNQDTTGHRLLRGGILLGGANLRRIPDPAHLEAIGADIRELVALALSHTSIRERFTGTAVLTRKQAHDLGTLGYVARASGLGDDARVSHPITDYGDTLTIPTRTSGDVLARFLIRADEIDVSVGLISELGRGLNPGYISSWPPIAPTRPTNTGSGIVEAWRGTITHRVELDTNGCLTRVKIADPSFFNSPAVPVALHNAEVPDFPLIHRSFNPSYAGNDL